MEVEESKNVIFGNRESKDGIEVVDLSIDLESKPPHTLEVCVDDTGKEVVPKKKKKFTCLICTRRFSQNAGRYNHMKKVHNIYPGEKANVRCLEKGCLFTCSYKEKLQLHLSEQHGIDMDVSIQTFKCLQDFLRWKDEFERQEKSRFVKKSGSRIREEGIRVAYYYCSRSGTYVSHSKGMKKAKKKGTSKSNHHCTASITCVELPDGQVEVKICSTHYGHDNELQHLRLTQTEKFHIAEQLSRGVPRDLVLDNVRASARSDVDRIHLITIKDVKNIEKAFGIQACSNEKTNNMFYNLNVWITNIMRSEHCPVLYFNDEGLVNTKSHDVTIILLTIGQLEVLQKYGNEGIFYITTSAAKSKQSTYCQNIRPSFIHVTTLMLVDDLNEAIPVSFMVSNNIDSKKFYVFFESLKEKIPEMSAKAVLTDDQQNIFEAWCSVFKHEPFHLWSNRFVDSDWRENLICISDEELQVSIYEKLYSFLESSDKDKLENTLNSYINYLQGDVITNKFGGYVASKYIGSERFWAGCYGKKIVGASAQLNMEQVCNDIEEIGHRKHWDRNFLVKIVQHLLKLVSEKQCIRQSKLQRQVQELPNHHSLALNVTSEFIIQESDSCWRVNSVKDPNNMFSYVNEQSHKCKPINCALYCSKCSVCAHEFCCSCKVYSYDRTMCKHIHAVALKLCSIKNEKTLALPSEEISENYQTDEKERINSKLILTKEVFRRKVNKTKKMKRKNHVDKNKLPAVIEGMVDNSDVKPLPRKRGRPRKCKSEEDIDKVKCENQQKTEEISGKQETFKNDNLQSTINLRPRRINILRKCQRKFV